MRDVGEVIERGAGEDEREGEGTLGKENACVCLPAPAPVAVPVLPARCLSLSSTRNLPFIELVESVLDTALGDKSCAGALAIEPALVFAFVSVPPCIDCSKLAGNN